MWASWTLVLVLVLVIGATVISLFVGGLIFGAAVAFVAAIGLLIAAGVRRAASEDQDAGAGLMESPSDQARFGTGAEDGTQAGGQASVSSKPLPASPEGPSRG